MKRPVASSLRQLRCVGGEPLADETDRPGRRHEPGGEIAALLARVDHGDREIRLRRARRAAQDAGSADRLADHRGGEAVPDAVRDDGPPVAVVDAHVGARRVRVAPVQVLRVADEMMRAEVHALRERPYVRAAAKLAAALLPQPLRPHPDPEGRHVLPAEPADEDRAGHRVREPERPPRPGRRRLLLVRELERREDPAPPRRGRRHRVHRERREPLAHPGERHGERAERGAVVVTRLVQDPRPGGVAVEPPVELGRRHRLPVRLLHQREELVAPRGLDDHFEDVPSAALKTRRARVPVTVSFTAMRSQAPASTSSKVRDEYGSTL